MSDEKVLIVDRREPADRIAQYEYEGFTVEVPADLLDSGDVVFTAGGKTVGIEIKTTAEIVSLVPSGLSQLAQFQRMATFDHRVLLIVGTFGVHREGKVLLDGYNRNSGLQYSSVMGALFNLQAHLGFLIRHAGQRKNIGRCVYNIWDFFSREHVLLAKPRPLTLSVAQAPALSALMTMPGIGPTQAERILQHFGTLERAFYSVSEWGAVPGIGPKTVAAVQALLQKEWFREPAAAV